MYREKNEKLVVVAICSLGVVYSKKKESCLSNS